MKKIGVLLLGQGIFMDILSQIPIGSVPTQIPLASFFFDGTGV
jgi:hypothetical protein